MVKYRYDAWDNCVVDTSTTNTELANINPFRYRSYYYDTGIGLYYLKTRYYDPEIGRFMTIDDISYLDPESINGLNLYAYCLDNPIIYSDGSGHTPNSIWKTLLGVSVILGLATVTVAAVITSGGTLLAPVLIGAGIGAGLNLASQGYANLKDGIGFFENINWWTFALGGLSGAAFATGAGGLIGTLIIGGSSSAGMSALEGNSWLNIFISAGAGVVAAGLGYYAGKLVSKYVPKDSSLTFTDYFEAGKIDANFFRATVATFAAYGYRFLPNIMTGLTRGVSKFVGNWIGDLV